MIILTVHHKAEMQRELQERYRGRWEPVSPETGKNKLLWMVGEVGEVIDIVKKTVMTELSATPN